MPTSARIAVGAVAALLLTNIGLLALTLLAGVIAPLLVVNAILTGLVLWGLLRRHRLAWQWGRVLAILSAVLSTILLVVDFLVEEFAIASGWLYGVVILQVVCLYAVFFALGRKSALEHFQLICPECHQTTKKAANFWFTRARCKACGHVW